MTENIYDYRYAVKADILDYIKRNGLVDKCKNKLEYLHRETSYHIADKEVKKLLAKMLVLKAHEKVCVESI